MRRFPANLQNLLLIGLGFPLIGLNLWVLSQLFRYFEHLITILTIAAIILLRFSNAYIFAEFQQLLEFY
jgi:hypothetical protein